MHFAFLFVSVLFAPHLVNGVLDRDRKIADRLNTKLFAMSEILHSLEKHTSKLDNWQFGVEEVENRLQTLESTLMAELAEVKQSLQQCQDQQSSFSQQLTDISTKMTTENDQRVSAVSELVSNVSSQHEVTRSACAGSVSSLTPRLDELLADGKQQMAVVHGAESRLQEQVELVGQAVQQVEERLGQVDENVQQQGQQLRSQLTTTTPAPTEDPRKLFLQNLITGLKKRQQKSD